jgi:hypothetical protein
MKGKSTFKYDPTNKNCPYEPNKWRNNRLVRKYGITETEYLELAKKQQFVCKICNGFDNERTLAVDHCHTEGTIRGLLCHKCNRGLGLFQDDIELLLKAINYLNDYAKTQVGT